MTTSSPLLLLIYGLTIRNNGYYHAEKKFPLWKDVLRLLSLFDDRTTYCTHLYND